MANSFHYKRFVFGVIFILLLSQSAHAWFDCNWYYRSDVVITENAGNNLNNYQVLIELNSASFHADYNWSSVGQDLRVIDSNDTTHLEYFIQTWNATLKQAKVWVKVPSLVANGSRTVYFYTGNSVATTTASATPTFTEPGIKFHTRYSVANPNNKAAGFNTFIAAADGVAGYGCKFITNFTSIRNQNQFAPPAINKNFGAYSETFFEVKPSEAGLWSVRYGGDFGRGGGLYVDDVALEEDWNTDLWWAYNWGHPDVLEGAISLTAGYHRLEVIGFEGCCDGGITVQFKKPAGVYQTYSTANIDILSRKCPTIEPSSVIPTKTYFPPNITISKTSEVFSDPVNLGVNPKRIAGATVRYTITVSNSGSSIDNDSVHIKDPVPTNTHLQLGPSNFTFQNGSPTSSLNFVYVSSNNAGDDVSFSDNGGTTFVYQPVIDANNTNSSISHFQFSPKGRFACSNTAGQPTSFSIKYDVEID